MSCACRYFCIISFDDVEMEFSDGFFDVILGQLLDDCPTCSCRAPLHVCSCFSSSCGNSTWVPESALAMNVDLHEGIQLAQSMNQTALESSPIPFWAVVFPHGHSPFSIISMPDGDWD